MHRRPHVYLVCLNGGVASNNKIFVGSFANDMGIITPSHIVVPRLRAILRALTYLIFCFLRTIGPAIYRNLLLSCTFLSCIVLLSCMFIKDIM